MALPAGCELAESAGEFRRAHAGLKVRWVRPENLHLTMVPPWQCLDVDAVCRALRDEAAQQAPFEVAFERVSFGPEPRRPRLIWATGKAPAGMPKFARRLLAATGAAGESRKSFLLHLTIARFNLHDFKAMGTLTLRETVAWSGKFDALCLYESMLKPGGAQYRELCRFVLGEKSESGAMMQPMVSL
ncbi:2'-5' RNA ligase family protein [Chlorobaculum sp. MV4-Y]|uniref:2'-5' RNA ligase family protein n=1 Tax=Chlorobaculum sp. MV4-Y TaxID=2976335 RepID=UPI0021AEEB15|nr:2'-5' RNA ligase family protein [Chlorobaculum sp. MV4-Y]UWX57041.1 2'-5' RNA ligase family protein [Chlorobaculum sp. MV4-Y]